MTNLREAAQQALEALEFLSLDFFMLDPISPGRESTIKAITALRAALAEPVQEPEPGEYHGWVLREVLFDNGEPVGHREPVQEPVAWLYEVGTDRTLHWHKPPLYGTPLYAAPPQRKPLSGLEVERLLEQVIGSLPAARRLVRAIERAHGIGGSDD